MSTAAMSWSLAIALMASYLTLCTLAILLAKRLLP